MSSVFISYCREDFEAIGRVLNLLEANSVPYWIDGQGIVPAMAFNDGIRSGLEQSPWFVVVMTPQSAESEYVKDELHWALTHRNGRVIPVMLQECEPADFHLRLQRIQYIDLTPKSKTGATQLQKMLAIVRNDDSLNLNNKKVDDDLELIALLLTFVSRNHQKHLRNLLPKSGADLASYVGCGSLRQELRDLCTWGLLKRRTDLRIADAVQDRQRFNLKEVVALTPLGKRVATYVS